MSVIGHADLDRPLSFDFGHVYYPYGGGPFHVEPFRCGVVTSEAGRVELRLELMRALEREDARATLACTVGAEYGTDAALELVRETAGAGAVAPMPLTDWWLRVPTSPRAGGSPALSELTEPSVLAANGLGTAQLVQSLSVDSAMFLEEMLEGDAPLQGVAEAGLVGVSPRLPVVVRFHASELIEALLELGDAQGAMPRRFIADFFGREVSTLPIEIDGTVDIGSSSRFADAMADRVVGRFGRYIPPQDLSDAPVVQLDAPAADISIIWSLEQPFLAARRLVLPVDLLSAAQAQIDRLGPESVIQRRSLASLPPLGHARVTALANLPSSRLGVEALGVTLSFPPHPPRRPQARTVTALFESPEDTAPLDVKLSPGEPLRYRYATFAVLADEGGVRQLDTSESTGSDPILHLAPADFPIDIACIEVTPALAGLAVITGSCSYELADGSYATRFALDDDRRSVGVAIPRDREGFSIEAVAVARDGSGQLPIGSFESLQVRLDVTSFPMYGPQQMEIRCVFDDAATIRAIQVRPLGTDGAVDNGTSVSFTPTDPVETYRWFAASPFASGFQYRPLGSGDRTWTDVAAGHGPLTLFSSQLQDIEAMREVAARSAYLLAEPARHETARHLETEEVSTETAVDPVGVSPVPEPTDEVIYTRVADPARKLFVPRFALDVQTVSGRQRYRIAMAQSDVTSTLEVNLVAIAAPSIAEQAREAEEYPHALGVFLDFLVATGSSIRKRLEFTEVTRNGAILTASLTFATLAERDDVYRAMTEPGRECRLIVRRTIDVSVPHEAPPSGTQPIDTVPDTKLPDRPFHKWPPDTLVPRVPLVTEPVRWTYPVDPDPRPILTAKVGSRLVNTAVALAVNDPGLSLKFARSRESDVFVRARLIDDGGLVLKRRLPEPTIPLDSTPPPEPSVPSHRAERHELEQVVEPDPFVFTPALHGYMFAGLTPTSGNNQLIRYRLPWLGTFHTYLQDASRPSVVYVFADKFKIARRRDAPFTPFVTVRVASRPDDAGTDVVFDYVVAPYTDARRLADATTKLLLDPRFGADHVEFQPLLTSDVRFFIDRPTETGSVHEARPSASVVLQGALKDTLTMPLGDFRILFDAMHGRTASLFVGHLEIDVPDEDTEVIPFVARMDDLQGELFSYQAASGAGGVFDVTIRNEIESPVSILTLDPTIVRDGTRVHGAVQSGKLPVDRLLPDATVRLDVIPEATTASTAPAEVTFDLSGVSVIPDPVAIWDSILDRTSVEYYRTVTVKAIATLFDPVAGREEEQILHILVVFDDGDTADLQPSTLEAEVRVDHPIDDVILGRPVDPAYRYTVTVIRANGDQDVDPEPRENTADLFFVSVTK